MTANTRSIPTGLAPATVVILVAGVIIAIGANAIVGFSALAAGASSEFRPLSFPIFAAYTAGGYLAAYLGWLVIRARATHPAAVLRVLVPVLTVLSFLPNVVLATGLIPNSSTTAIIALALMHMVVVAVTVPVFLRVAPVR